MPTNRFEIVTGQRKMHSIKLFVVIILWVCIRLVSFYYLYKTMFPFFPLDLHFNITKHKDPEDIHVYGNKAKIVDVNVPMINASLMIFKMFLFIYLFRMKLVHYIDESFFVLGLSIFVDEKLFFFLYLFFFPFPFFFFFFFSFCL